MDGTLNRSGESVSCGQTGPIRVKNYAVSKISGFVWT